MIGCGNWGKNLIRVLGELGALKAICDTDHAKAASYSEKYHVQQYTFENILKSDEIDAVFIATPSATHYEIGLACLKANKHVYMEKPLALSTQHAITLKQQADQQNRLLMVGHLLQYHNAFHALKKLKKDGILGDLQYIYCNRFNFGKFRNEESVLWDYAPHDISMILSLIEDMPYRVMATNGNHLMHTTADTTTIALYFASNIRAHIFSSWLYPFKEQKMIVVGSKAMAIFEDSQPWESKLKLCRYPAEWVDGLPQPFPHQSENVPVVPSEPLVNECRHFLDCILEHTQPLTDSIEGIRVMTVLDAAALSMTTEEPVKLTDPTQMLELSKKASVKSKQNRSIHPST